MKSETAKLPSGQSYPLRPSKLKEALTTAGVSLDVHLSRSPGVLFDAHFWPPTPEVPYERLYVRAGSVTSEQVADARRKIEERVLPTLVRWIARILSENPKSPMRREKQVLDLQPL